MCSLLTGKEFVNRRVIVLKIRIRQLKTKRQNIRWTWKIPEFLEMTIRPINKMWFGRFWQRVIKADRTTFVLTDRCFTSPFFKRCQSWSSHISLIGLYTYMGGSERVGTMCVCVALQFVVTSCSLHFRFDLLSRLCFSATSASFKLRSSSLRWKMESQYQSVCFSPPSPSSSHSP